MLSVGKNVGCIKLAQPSGGQSGRFRDSEYIPAEVTVPGWCALRSVFLVLHLLCCLRDPLPAGCVPQALCQLTSAESH